MKFKKYKLGEIASFSQGKQVPINEQYEKPSESMKRFIRIVDYTNNEEPTRYVVNYGDKYYASKEELVMIRYGSQTAGMVVMGKNGIIANNLFKITLNNSKVLNKYMYYYLSQKNILKYLRRSQSSSTMPAISFEIMNNLEVMIPNISNQDKIINLLEKLDKKIEVNNQINDNLSELVTNVFKEKIIKTNNIALVKMNDLVENTIGGDWGKEELTGNYNTEVLCIRGADIPEMDSGNKGKAPNRFILEKNLYNKQLLGDEIIIEISGGSPTQSTGRCTYITKELKNSFDKPLICTNFCRAIKLKDNKYLPIFYMNLKYLYKKNIMFLYENGTTGIKNLDLTSLMDNEEINIVDDKTLNQFNKLYYVINKKIIQNASENRMLEELRDTLLPKLMNGDIDLDNIKIQSYK